MFKAYDKFTANFKKVIQRAAWLCLNELKKMITPDHLFLGMLSVPESLAYKILTTTKIIQPTNTGATDEPNASVLTRLNPKINYDEVFNLSMDRQSIEILEKAADIAIKHEHTFIGTEHLLAAMAELQVKPLLKKIENASIKISDLQKRLENLLHSNTIKYLKAQTKLPATTSLATPNLAPPSSQINKLPKKNRTLLRKERKTKREKLAKTEILSTPALDYFTIDLTSSKKQVNLHPLIGREREIERLINILSRKHKNNPLLLGEPGVGKTAIVEGLAQKIYQGQIPDILANKRILSLDLNAVVAGTIYRGEFESRLKQIIEEAKSQDDVILFIDEIHNLIGAGSASGSLDAANILKPHLARGELACIGATTLAEYKARFESDATLDRRFQPIIVEEPTRQETTNILRGLRGKMEEYHQITITDEAVEEAINLSERFLPNKFFPDKAIDLLDEAASRLKVSNIKDTHGKSIRKLKNKLKRLIVKKEKAVKSENFQEAISLKKTEERLIKQLEILRSKQKKAHHKKIGIIKQEHIVQIITDIVKIPFLEMANIDKNKLLNLEGILRERVLGQEKVIKEIARTLRRAEAGLADPKRPLASFIFLGPSGVGKTETAKAIAEEIFGDKNALIRINMSEFQESFNVSKLIGAPAGYVGYKDSNQLADRVRSKPYSVVLFDEMEKAHPDIFNLLLQVLEDGYLVEASGKQVNFKNTVIILTSNIGLERFNQTQSLGFTAKSASQKQQLKEKFEQIKSNILDKLYNTFRVEFLNRIDKILVFEPLDYQTLTKIVELNIKELNKRLLNKKMKVNLSTAAKKWLARHSFSPDDGARSVRRVIQEKIEEILVEKILKGSVEEGDEVKVGISGKKIVMSK